MKLEFGNLIGKNVEQFLPSKVGMWAKTSNVPS